MFIETSRHFLNTDQIVYAFEGDDAAKTLAVRLTGFHRVPDGHGGWAQIPVEATFTGPDADLIRAALRSLPVKPDQPAPTPTPNPAPTPTPTVPLS